MVPGNQMEAAAAAFQMVSTSVLTADRMSCHVRYRKIMAERGGFEPPVPFQARTLSRRLV